MKEFDIVELQINLPYVKRGAIGTIVYVYPDNKTFEVEFVDERKTETIESKNLKKV